MGVWDLGQIWRSDRRLTPSQQFSLLLLVVLLAGGTGLSALAAGLVQQTVLGHTWVETQNAVASHFDSVFGTSVFDQPLLVDHAGHAAAAAGPGAAYQAPGASAATATSGAQSQAFDLARFDRSVQFHFNVYEIIHARFYRPDGRIVYSYAPAEVGRLITEVLPADAVARSLQGERVTQPVAGEAIDPRTGRRSTNTHALYVAVLRDGQIAGAAWVQRDVTGLTGAIRQAQAALVGVIFGVVALLFITLRRIYGDSTETIRSQTVALAGAYGELRDTYDATLRALATALDTRDNETAGHAQRVTRLAVRLGQELGLSPAALLELERGAMLHDIGKIGVPDAILRKPGPLTDEEWALMRRHAAFGAAMLDGIPFLSDAVPLVRHHHERWDGRGYPDGLAGEAIPLGARIFAVADAFDAMTSDRPYRRPMSLAQARAELARCAGSQFDPAVVAAHARIADAELLALMAAPVEGSAEQAA
jgi:HD-GYP domain-containing protein (c-di-GMP phosphodiesterase class II)